MNPSGEGGGETTLRDPGSNKTGGLKRQRPYRLSFTNHSPPPPPPRRFALPGRRHRQRGVSEMGLAVDTRPSCKRQQLLQQDVLRIPFARRPHERVAAVVGTRRETLTHSLFSTWSVDQSMVKAGSRYDTIGTGGEESKIFFPTFFFVCGFSLTFFFVSLLFREGGFIRSERSTLLPDGKARNNKNRSLRLV